MKHLRSVSRKVTNGLAYASTFAFLQFLAPGAYAQNNGLGNLPEIPGIADPTDTNVFDTVVNVINFVLGFLSLIAVVFVIVGGFRILAAGGNEENVTKGRKTVIYAVIGLVVIFFANVIVGFFTQELTNAVAP